MPACRLIQTGCHRRRFNRLEDEITRMRTPNGVANDGGEPDTVGVLLLVLSGAFFGIAFAQTYSPDYVVPISLVGAWLMVRTLGDV